MITKMTFLQSLQDRRDFLDPREMRILEEHSLQGVKSFINKRVKRENSFVLDIIRKYAEIARLPSEMSISRICVEINANFKPFRDWVGKEYSAK